MTRRARRSGVRYIEKDKERSLTFFKRRAGIYKAAADLSTLTGARVVVVVESESGKFSSFGSPAVYPIVDAFLSRKASMRSYVSEAQKAIITKLQNEVFQLEKDVAMDDKMKKDATALVKELQGSSRIGKIACGKVEDLAADEICEMYHDLTLIHQEIDRLLHALQHGERRDAGALRDPSLLKPAWWPSQPSSQMSAPWVLPWIPIQPAVQQMLPSQQQLPPRSLAPSMVPLQAEKMRLPEPIPYDYHIWGVNVTSNNSNLLLQSHMLPSQPPHPPSPQIPPLDESFHWPPQAFLPTFPIDGHQLPANNTQIYNPVELSQNFASFGSTSPIDMTYNANLGEPNLGVGRSSENGGQINGWIDELMSEYSFVGGNSGAGASNNLGGITFPWN